jgi:acyl transferase domain-containing protein
MEEKEKYKILMAKALVEVRQLKARLKERGSSEPVAVVGIGCRFPGGADSPEAYWRLLREGVDAIAEVPKDRWDIDAYYDPDPAVPGKMVCRSGGFLPAVDGFDASFFGIARREAEGMDPQQRLLLEVAWEALEHAGQAPEALFKTSTGVFTGISSFDYATTQLLGTDVRELNAYLGTGIALSAANGRLSYVLGLMGPSMSVDTACSSSLVAVHLACRSLRLRECGLALAGGVNVILLPELSINFSKAGMLAPDGRCKTFDASADGYVRGEGCGVVVLKRLTDAMSDGDRIMAVIRGSAVNQDGASGGLTVPSGPSQEAVIRRALSDGGVEASEVGYIEAHGTGTSLGDPIEVGALGRVFGGRPGGDPLLIGSVKTNIGHLEAASGIAALIKAVLSLERGEIPAHLHFRRPNPHIAWETLPFEIPIETRRWPEGKKRMAGVSSFGFTGTNAHVVLEEGPVPVGRESAVDRPVHLLALSARSEAALKELAGRYVTHLESHPAEAIADVCFTANAGRSHFEERAAVVGATREEIGSGCRAFCEGREAPNVRCGKPESGKIAFLFTGQGSQYKGMGRELYGTAPPFKEVIDRCTVFLEGKLPRTLTELLYGPGDGEELEDTAVQQPALFAVEMALYELWKSWGIEPSLVLGHSIGEYAAACAAGVFSLEEGLGLIAERGRLMAAIGIPGAMAACAATEERVGRLIAPWEALSLAALNGPESVVISGPGAALEEALSVLSREGIAVRRLKVSQAFHSVLMEEILPAFGKAADKVVCRAPQLGFVSNLTGDLLSEVGGDYWLGHARSPVRFRQGMETLRREGCGIFVEMGPNPVLLGMGRRCVEGRIWLPSLREGQDDWRRILTSLGDLYAAGIRRVLREKQGCIADLSVPASALLDCGDGEARRRVGGVRFCSSAFGAAGFDGASGRDF